jgi:hypothetical protein
VQGWQATEMWWFMDVSNNVHVLYVGMCLHGNGVLRLHQDTSPFPLPPHFAMQTALTTEYA